jgi:hypothetical protein
MEIGGIFNWKRGPIGQSIGQFMNRPCEGRVFPEFPRSPTFQGKPIDHLPPHKIIRTINLEGGILLPIEQNAQMALRLANRGYVLETVSIATEGSSRELISNDKVRKAYMGF